MTSPLVNLLFNVPMFIWTGFYIVAIVAVLAIKTNAASAKSKVVAGLGIQMLATVGGMILRWGMAYYLDSERMMLGHGIVNIATSVLTILGIVMLISAAFTERDLPVQSQAPAGSFGNENPYASPTQT